MRIFGVFFFFKVQLNFFGNTCMGHRSTIPNALVTHSQQIVGYSQLLAEEQLAANDQAGKGS